MRNLRDRSGSSVASRSPDRRRSRRRPTDEPGRSDLSEREKRLTASGSPFQKSHTAFQAPRLTARRYGTHRESWCTPVALAFCGSVWRRHSRELLSARRQRLRAGVQGAANAELVTRPPLESNADHEIDAEPGEKVLGTAEPIGYARRDGHSQCVPQPRPHRQILTEPPAQISPPSGSPAPSEGRALSRPWDGRR
jgi:hypothetical protein